MRFQIKFLICKAGFKCFVRNYLEKFPKDAPLSMEEKFPPTLEHSNFKIHIPKSIFRDVLCPNLVDCARPLWCNRNIVCWRISSVLKYIYACMRQTWNIEIRKLFLYFYRTSREIVSGNFPYFHFLLPSLKKFFFL